MSDLIDRDEVIEIIEYVCSADDTYWKPGTLEKIRNLPTHPTPSNTLGALDCIDRHKAINIRFSEGFDHDGILFVPYRDVEEHLKKLPSVQPTTLTEDDKETIRIHLSAFKERLCNQRRWNEAKEYEELISRILSTPSVQPRMGLWIDIKHTFMTKCSVCDWINNDDSSYNFCPCCGADMRPQFEEPEINPCRGCEDYDGKGGCKSKGGCAKSRGEEDE